MQYYTLLMFGFLIGMQHALEADHLAAVATMTTGKTSRRALILRGGVWGLGHTFTLLTICGSLLIWGSTISAHTQSLLELAVGVMVVLLGVNVLLRLLHKRPHFHIHHHDTGIRHVHAHTHQNDLAPHKNSPHPHPHHSLGLGRAMLIGMMHGMAGSAGLLILAAGSGSVMNAIGYVLAFGFGSILGMATLSFVASYPLRFLDRHAGWINTAGFASVGCAAVLVGFGLVVENWAAL